MYKVQATTHVLKKIKKLSKKDTELFYIVVEKLKQDPFDKTLKTHKLKGSFDKEYSCSLSYKNRLIFIFIEDKNITIIDIGSHDEVY
jgi:mRNA-degrading endonuclease YafQ of YafQ-DinJ toxin-antitoxin module